MDVITVRNLSLMGRVGNQMFLYAFAKAYALAMGCKLEIPADWWGRRVFANCNEPVISKHLQQTDLDSKSKRPLGYFLGWKNIDLFIYAQHQKYLDFYSRAQVREWFKFKPEFENLYAPGEVGHPVPYSAAHLRRGDYTTKFTSSYCTVSDWSYERAVKKFNVPEPLIKITEGWRPEPPALVHQGLGWVPDFLMLRDADYLLRANSTFSVWAGWLSRGRVYSPVVHKLVGWQDVEFVEGNHENTAGIFHNQSALHLKET